MNTSILNDVQLDGRARASINYAKARAAIEQAIDTRKERRLAKNTVIEYLGGECHEHSVKFPDGSKAKY